MVNGGLSGDLVFGLWGAPVALLVFGFVSGLFLVLLMDA